MATVLDLSLLNFASPIFAALLVFAIVYALLETTKILGSNKRTINAFVAIILSLLVLISSDLVNLIEFIAPWFVISFIFLTFFIMMYKIFGATDKDLAGFIKTDKPTQWALFAIGLLILLAGLGTIFGQRLLPVTQGENVTTTFTSNLFEAVFNPKVLGMLLLIGISVFAIALLTGEN